MVLDDPNDEGPYPEMGVFAGAVGAGGKSNGEPPDNVLKLCTTKVKSNDISILHNIEITSEIFLVFEQL